MRDCKKGLWAYIVILIVTFGAVFASTGFILASASAATGGADVILAASPVKPAAVIRIAEPEKLQDVPEISAEEYFKMEEALDADEENVMYEETPKEPVQNASEADDVFPYYIMVNRQANCVTVYAKDEAGAYTVPVRAMICSVGLNNNTPVGVFKTSTKYAWRALYGGVYGQYAFRIHGAILFHSVPYFTKSKDDLKYEEYNKLGEPASLGCVRLSVEDAKWLVDNCPSGTMVEIYDSENPGPLARPCAAKIPPESSCRGWDPTDPDPANPWVQVAPVISGAADRSYSAGSVFDLLSGVSAADYLGRNVVVTVSGTVNSAVSGNYTVVYSATDANGNTADVTAIITITAAETPEGSGSSTGANGGTGSSTGTGSGTNGNSGTGSSSSGASGGTDISSGTDGSSSTGAGGGTNGNSGTGSSSSGTGGGTGADGGTSGSSTGADGGTGGSGSTSVSGGAGGSGSTSGNSGTGVNDAAGGNNGTDGNNSHDAGDAGNAGSTENAGNSSNTENSGSIHDTESTEWGTEDTEQIESTQNATVQPPAARSTEWPEANM